MKIVALLIAAMVVSLAAGSALAMDDAGFQAALKTGDRTDLSRPQRAFAFDGLIARKDLSQAQKAEAYWRRALFRMSDGADQIDAISDYEQAQLLNPGDTRIGPALAYARSNAADVQGRLSGESSEPRANDLYQLGRWKEAEAIWKAMVKIGTYPDPIAIRHLFEDNILCKPKSGAKGGGGGVPAESTDGLGDLVFCTL